MHKVVSAKKAANRSGSGSQENAGGDATPTTPKSSTRRARINTDTTSEGTKHHEGQEELVKKAHTVHAQDVGHGDDTPHGAHSPAAVAKSKKEDAMGKATSTASSTGTKKMKNVTKALSASELVNQTRAAVKKKGSSKSKAKPADSMATVEARESRDSDSDDGTSVTAASPTTTMTMASPSVKSDLGATSPPSGVRSLEATLRSAKTFEGMSASEDEKTEREGSDAQQAMKHTETEAEAETEAEEGGLMPKVGERLAIARAGKEVVGTCAFVGKTKFATGTWIGIVLLHVVGKNDGSVNGIRYFDAPGQRGVFVKPSMVKRILAAEEQVEAPQRRAGQGKSRSSVVLQADILKQVNNMKNSQSEVVVELGCLRDHLVQAEAVCLAEMEAFRITHELDMARNAESELEQANMAREAEALVEKLRLELAEELAKRNNLESLSENDSSARSGLEQKLKDADAHGASLKDELAALSAKLSKSEESSEAAVARAVAAERESDFQHQQVQELLAAHGETACEIEDEMKARRQMARRLSTMESEMKAAQSSNSESISVAEAKMQALATEGSKLRENYEKVVGRSWLLSIRAARQMAQLQSVEKRSGELAEELTEAGRKLDTETGTLRSDLEKALAAHKIAEDSIGASQAASHQKLEQMQEEARAQSLKITALQEECEKTEARGRALVEELTTASAAQASLAEEFKAAQDAKINLENLQKTHQAELIESTEKYVTLQAQLQQAEVAGKGSAEELVASSSTIAALRAELASAMQQLTEAKQGQEAAAGASAESEKISTTMKLEIEEHRSRVVTLQEEWTKSESHGRSLMEELTTTKTAHANVAEELKALQDAKADLEASRAAQEVELTESAARYSDLETKLEQAESSARGPTQELETRQIEIKTLQDELAEARASLLASQKASQAELDASKAQSMDLQGKLHLAEAASKEPLEALQLSDKTIKALQEELAAATTRFEAAKLAEEAAQAQARENQEKLEISLHEALMVKSELEANSGASSAQLQETIQERNALKEELREASKQREALQGEMKQQLAHAEMLMAKKEKQVAECNLAITQHAASEKALQEALESSRKAAEDTVADSAATKAREEELRAALLSAEAQRDASRQQLLEVEKELATAFTEQARRAAEDASQANEISRLQEALAKAEAKILALTSAFAESEQTSQEAANAGQSLQEKQAALESQLRQTAEAYTEVQKALQAAEAAAQAESARSSEFQVWWKAAQGEAENLAVCAEYDKALRKDLEASKQELESANILAKSQTETLRSELREAHESIESSKSQLLSSSITAREIAALKETMQQLYLCEDKAHQDREDATELSAQKTKELKELRLQYQEREAEVESLQSQVQTWRGRAEAADRLQQQQQQQQQQQDLHSQADSSRWNLFNFWQQAEARTETGGDGAAGSTPGGATTPVSGGNKTASLWALTCCAGRDAGPHRRFVRPVQVAQAGEEQSAAANKAAAQKPRKWKCLVCRQNFVESEEIACCKDCEARLDEEPDAAASSSNVKTVCAGCGANAVAFEGAAFCKGCAVTVNRAEESGADSAAGGCPTPVRPSPRPGNSSGKAAPTPAAAAAAASSTTTTVTEPVKLAMPDDDEESF